MVQKFNIGRKKHTSILLAALDWGLGHATRCIPIIRYLVQNGCEVVIAAEGKQLALLQLEFPDLQFISLRGYRFQYSNNRWKTIVKIIGQIPGLFFSVSREHRWLENYAKQKRFDAVISDNRYGFYLPGVRSVFITHQLNIQTPFGKPVNAIINWFNYLAIRRFDSCWVPDLAGGDNLGGKLSHPAGLPSVPVSYLGALSRFSFTSESEASGPVLILISGPEPQRRIFEKKILAQVADIVSTDFVLVRGLPGVHDRLVAPSHVTAYNHLATADLEEAIMRASYIVSRSGYSTIMEMLSAGKKCLFIPTPGQTEQEYLADYLSEKGYCVSARQVSFSLSQMIATAQGLQWRKMNASKGLAEKVLDKFLESLRTPH